MSGSAVLLAPTPSSVLRLPLRPSSGLRRGSLLLRPPLGLARLGRLLLRPRRRVHLLSLPARCDPVSLAFALLLGCRLRLVGVPGAGRWPRPSRRRLPGRSPVLGPPLLVGRLLVPVLRRLVRRLPLCPRSIPIEHALFLMRILLLQNTKKALDTCPCSTDLKYAHNATRDTQNASSGGCVKNSYYGASG